MGWYMRIAIEGGQAYFNANALSFCCSIRKWLGGSHLIFIAVFVDALVPQIIAIFHFLKETVALLVIREYVTAVNELNELFVELES